LNRTGPSDEYQSCRSSCSNNFYKSHIGFFCPDQKLFEFQL
jgi:hypothetical protein